MDVLTDDEEEREAREASGGGFSFLSGKRQDKGADMTSWKPGAETGVAVSADPATRSRPLPRLFRQQGLPVTHARPASVPSEVGKLGRCKLKLSLLL